MKTGSAHTTITQIIEMALNEVHNTCLGDHRLDRLLDPKLFLDLVSVNTTSATPAFSVKVDMITTGLRDALAKATTEVQQQIVGDLIATLKYAIEVSAINQITSITHLRQAEIRVQTERGLLR